MSAEMLAVLFTGVSSLIASIGTFIITWRSGKVIKKVKEESSVIYELSNSRLSQALKDNVELREFIEKTKITKPDQVKLSDTKTDVVK